MPNHIYQKIAFLDLDEKQKKEIKEYLGTDLEKGILLDFNKIIPQPEGIKDERPMILSDAEYSFNNENWGTKWNSYENNIESDLSDEYIFTFQTAWNAPKPILNRIFEKFPNIRIKYIAVCEGGWFAYYYNQDENDEGEYELIKIELTKDNDKDHKIRDAISFLMMSC